MIIYIMEITQDKFCCEMCGEFYPKEEQHKVMCGFEDWIIICESCFMGSEE